MNKVVYTDDVTVIGAQNLNDIQDAVIDTVPKSTGGTFDGNVQINKADGTTSTVGTSTLRVGNDTASGTDGNSKGRVIIYGEGNKYANIQASSVTGNQTLELPNTSGTIMTDQGGTFSKPVAIDEHNGTTSSLGASHLTLGNSISSGTAGNSTASLTMYGRQSYYTALYTAETLTSNRSIYFPDAGGTIALQNTVITGTSFANMTTVPQYPRNVMETIRTDIASYSNGIYNVASSGGPQYFAHIGKYNNNYWAAMLQTYTDENIYFVQYANGACKVRIISQ